MDYLDKTKPIHGEEFDVKKVEPFKDTLPGLGNSRSPSFPGAIRT